MLTNIAFFTRAISHGLLPADAPYDALNATRGSAAERLAELRRVRTLQFGETIGHLQEIIDPEKGLLVGLNTDDGVRFCSRLHAGARRRPASTPTARPRTGRTATLPGR